MKSLTRLIVAGAAVIAASLILTACSGMWENMKDKSYNVGGGGIGGVFTTSIDATTGTPTPSMKMGDVSVSVMSHKEGDGDNIRYRKDKSFWGSEVGSEEFAYMGKDKVKSIQIIAIPQGQTTITVTGLDESTTVDSGSSNSAVAAVAAGSFQTALKAQLDKHGVDKNAQMFEDISKIRTSPLADPELVAWRGKLADMSDVELSSLKPCGVAAKDRLAGDECLYRALKIELASK